MISMFFQLARQILRKLYVRVLLIAALSVVSVLLAKQLDWLIPEGVAERIGADSVDPILATLASSMLAVTIFSLTMMTSAHRAAETQWSPRTHVILKDDTLTHSVLAVFVGAFLFSLCAMVLRHTPFFGERESVALFGVTAVVIVMIVVSIIRWIAHLEDLGSLNNTVSQVEQRAGRALRTLGASGCYGAREMEQEHDPGGFPVPARRAGYVEQVFLDILQSQAAGDDTQVYVLALPGDYVQEGQVLARIGGAAGADRSRDYDEGFRIARARSFVQDPRFGVAVLADIASRALSPGINDPGTAIHVVDRLSSLLLLAGEGAGGKTRFDRVWIRALDAGVLFEDSFDRIARDAGGMVEVQVAIQCALGAIAARADDRMARAATDCAARSLARARDGLTEESERARLEAAAAV
ncbi:Uncharacterized membrane protein [Cribrihabitans marinus]|uniref:Uncharacterized membrane protein n=1 Tax=Cribrihabitans marinus TaxID=1227549 RepID=A0A1H6QTQ2_9RHOB|nr:DUF2254 domain-containing protein [Cribrihabitans marinus]GGH19224.1 hypothetical protein GCM10010973_02480 [Cribrihabitans marinus]SEI44314.1 Uncharacterized membrane protein [Cribrihabitans marinus]